MSVFMAHKHDGSAFWRPQYKRRSGKTGAFSLVETVVSIGVFALILMMFAALFPVATRGSGESRAYAQAALLCQRKIDQMRQAGYSSLNVNSLRAINIIDATSNADGTFSFKTVDNIVDNGTNKGYFAAGTVTSIAIGQPLPALGASAPPLSRAVLVTVSITWPSQGYHGGTFSTHTIIAAQ